MLAYYMHAKIALYKEFAKKVQNANSKPPRVNNFIYTVTAELVLHALVQFMVCV